MKIHNISMTTALLTSSLIFSTIAFADSTHYYSGGYVAAANIKYWKDSSVNSYGYGAWTDSAANAWNNISSKVKISETSSDPA